MASRASGAFCGFYEKLLSFEICQSIPGLRNEGYSMWKIAPENGRFHKTVCTTPIREQGKPALNRIEREVRGHSAPLSKSTSESEKQMPHRSSTGSFITLKTSVSTVKGQLQDIGF